MSIDGYVDSVRVKRLPLSNDAYFDRVDAVRASCDAILVGAATVRHDDPRLQVRSPRCRQDRIARGLPESPMRVTITGRGRLDPRARIFHGGTAPTLVSCASPAVDDTTESLGTLATVVDGGEPVDLHALLDDRSVRGALLRYGLSAREEAGR